MLKNMKAVIFDLDGTLVDSMWMWRDIDIEYLGRFGIPLPETLQKDISGMPFAWRSISVVACSDVRLPAVCVFSVS